MTEKQASIIELRKQGNGFRKIGEIVHVNKDYAREICRQNGLGGILASREVVCKRCGKAYTTWNSNSKYCSIECRVGENAERLKKCEVCGAEFKPHSRQKYCSDECRKSAWQKMYHDRFVSKAKHVEKYCPACGNVFTTTSSRQKFCSKKCGKKYRGDGRIYRVSKDERLKQCVQNDKSLWLQPLIKRDNNTCQICGRKCDLYDYEVTASGAMICGDRYPTIDHIVPLSKGGQHIWANAQLACRKCNREKGADD